MITSVLRHWSQRRITVASFANQYTQQIRSHNLSPKTFSNRRNHLRHLLRYIGPMPLRHVRPSDVSRAVTSVWESGREWTSRGVLWEAEALFYAAVVEGIISTNPATPIKPPRAPVQRARLQLEEWQRIHAWSEENALPWEPYLMLLALVTGQRRGDLVAMRKSHIVDGHLRVEQQKTGARIELPLALRLDALGITLEETIRLADDYRRPGDLLLRRRHDVPFCPKGLSPSFQKARMAVYDDSHWAPRTPPTLHEIRSLAERLYRAQGVDTRILLGHRVQTTTDGYNDDRRRTDAEWKRLQL